jgi:hypothetical protein
VVKKAKNGRKEQRAGNGGGGVAVAGRFFIFPDAIAREEAAGEGEGTSCGEEEKIMSKMQTKKRTHKTTNQKSRQDPVLSPWARTTGVKSTSTARKTITKHSRTSLNAQEKKSKRAATLHLRHTRKDTHCLSPKWATVHIPHQNILLLDNQTHKTANDNNGSKVKDTRLPRTGLHLDSIPGIR